MEARSYQSRWENNHTQDILPTSGPGGPRDAAIPRSVSLSLEDHMMMMEEPVKDHTRRRYSPRSVRDSYSSQASHRTSETASITDSGSEHHLVEDEEAYGRYDRVGYQSRGGDRYRQEQQYHNAPPRRSRDPRDHGYGDQYSNNDYCSSRQQQHQVYQRQRQMSDSSYNHVNTAYGRRANFGRSRFQDSYEEGSVCGSVCSRNSRDVPACRQLDRSNSFYGRRRYEEDSQRREKIYLNRSRRSVESIPEDSISSRAQPPRLPPRQKTKERQEGLPPVGYATREVDNSSSSRSNQEAPVMVDIAPGVQARLRRMQETLDAVADDYYSAIDCFACQEELFCITNVSYILCPNCKVISPMPEKTRDHHGLGMGFNAETLMAMQNDILKKRDRSRGYR